MDTQQVERELTAILHRRAEAAMSLTDTPKEYRRLQSGQDGPYPHKARRRWAVAVAAAAVVALVVGVALWPSAQDEGGGRLPATDTPHTTSSANLAAAEGAAAAYVAHDEELLEPLLEQGVAPAASSWSFEFKRNAAWSVDFRMEPCTEKSSVGWGRLLFRCPFSMHVLGSREVGKGPFPGNWLDVIVEDGKVRWAQTTTTWQSNGTARHVDSVVTWLEENPPADSRCNPRSPKACAEFMLMDEQQVTSADWPTWHELWQHAIADYVAAHKDTG